MARKNSIILATAWLLLLLLLPKVCSQDLYVSDISVSPSSVAAGDTVEVTAHVGNNGPGSAFYVQFQCYISPDDIVTVDDTTLGDHEVLTATVYEGSEISISRFYTVPPLNDPNPPTYIGLLLDTISDSDPSNNAGVAEITFTGSPTPANSFFDTSGDHAATDITSVQTKIENGSLDVTVHFSSEPFALYGLMAIDFDQNPSTGAGLKIPGVEAIAELLIEKYAPPMLTVWTEGQQQSLNSAALDGTKLTFSIPLSYVGNDSSMDLFWAFAQTWSADFDRAPDVGVFDTATNEVVVRRPGTKEIHVDISDPATGDQEPSYPNMNRLQADVVGDQLQVILTFEHSAEVQYPVGNGMIVYISIDSDKSLCSGFKSGFEFQPTFGFDYELVLYLDAITGVFGELWRDENDDGFAYDEVRMMGLPHTDMMFKISGNRVICNIPLSYIGFNDEIGAVQVSSHKSDVTDVTVLDLLPDAGAWDFLSNQIIPEQTCTTTPREVADSDNDSVGGVGLDNDELVKLDLCVGRDAILFTIHYTKYQLSSSGVTEIFLDVDQNTATGGRITNIGGSTEIGADYVLATYFDIYTLKQVTTLTRNFEPVYHFWKPQLTRFNIAGNRLYITIPLDCIGNPAGDIDILVQTSPIDGFVSYDDLPDQGVITLSIEGSDTTRPPAQPTAPPTSTTTDPDNNKLPTVSPSQGDKASPTSTTTQPTAPPTSTTTDPDNNQLPTVPPSQGDTASPTSTTTDPDNNQLPTVPPSQGDTASPTSTTKEHANNKLPTVSPSQGDNIATNDWDCPFSGLFLLGWFLCPVLWLTNSMFSP